MGRDVTVSWFQSVFSCSRVCRPSRKDSWEGKKRNSRVSQLSFAHEQNPTTTAVPKVGNLPRASQITKQRWDSASDKDAKTYTCKLRWFAHKHEWRPPRPFFFVRLRIFGTPPPHPLISMYTGHRDKPS